MPGYEFKLILNMIKKYAYIMDIVFQISGFYNVFIHFILEVFSWTNKKWILFL